MQGLREDIVWENRRALKRGLDDRGERHRADFSSARSRPSSIPGVVVRQNGLRRERVCDPPSPRIRFDCGRIDRGLPGRRADASDNLDGLRPF